MKRFVFCLSVLILSMGLSQQAQAGLIVDRLTLDSLLGGSAVTEDFESFSVAAGDARTAFLVTLDSSSVFDNQGPGLVVPGVSFVSEGNGIQWNGVNYYGQPSKDILASGSVLEINFSQATTAFGMDLLVFSGFPDLASIQVYGLDDTTLLYTTPSDISITTPSNPVFFGYGDTSGIGKARLTSMSIGAWSPFIDDLTFGTNSPVDGVVPEPASMILMGIGLAGAAWRKRKRA